ncbi:MAG TPA: adenylate/guanylate cyclase domain-containing protein [Methylomirabilota bacterium]|jgi:class 3 adenylate cyclase|nr:adenylate/guanylate cyclase domain-containing protein [Methylomirabilota bacterium]
MKPLELASLDAVAPAGAGSGPATAPATGLVRWMERIADALTRCLDVDRIATLIGETLDELVSPLWYVVLLTDAVGRGHALVADQEAHTPRRVRLDGPLPTWLTRLRAPVAGPRLFAVPAVTAPLGPDRFEPTAVPAELVVPLVFRDAGTGGLLLGPTQGGRAYSAEDIRVLRLLAKQGAVALEQVKAQTTLAAARGELEAALRRVELLEEIRAHLENFVPKTVQTLIEKAPDAPDLGRREADVSVLFVDIVGYTRLAEHLDPRRATYLVERYFGAFLDEILQRGGDVNETTGDGLMVIFQDVDPGRHARAAVEAAVGIIRRTHELNAELTELFEPIALHVGVNSGTAALGVTRMKGESGTRWTYTATGSLTNLAARLAELSSGDAVMVGPGTRERLAEFDFAEEGTVRLRNVEQPVRVFRLAVPPSPPPRGVPSGGPDRLRRIRPLRRREPAADSLRSVPD